VRAGGRDWSLDRGSSRMEGARQGDEVEGLCSMWGSEGSAIDGRCTKKRGMHYYWFCEIGCLVNRCGKIVRQTPKAIYFQRWSSHFQKPPIFKGGRLIF